MEWIHGMDFIQQELAVIPFYIHPIIPGEGIVLFHGSPGIGKSTVMWQMMNCFYTGKPFVNLEVSKTKALLLNLDMPKVGIYNRWRESNFEPQFDILFSDEFNCLKTGFHNGEFYKKVSDIHQREKYGVVVVDALGRVINSSVNNDDLPNQVYATFTQWFPHACIIFIHHDRKRKQKDDGVLAAATEEDFLGSQYWKAFAAIQLHLYKVNDSIVRLSHIKSQLGILMEGELNLYMNEEGTSLEEWSEHQQSEEARKFMEAEARMRKEYPDWDTFKTVKKIEYLGRFLGKGQATVYRWKKSAMEAKIKP